MKMYDSTFLSVMLAEAFFKKLLTDGKQTHQKLLIVSNNDELFSVYSELKFLLGKKNDGYLSVSPNFEKSGGSNLPRVDFVRSKEVNLGSNDTNPKIFNLIGKYSYLTDLFDINLIPDANIAPLEFSHIEPEFADYRARAFASLLAKRSSITIVTVKSLTNKVVPLDVYAKFVHKVKVDSSIGSIDEFVNVIEAYGYVNVEYVSSIGEYTVRGSLIDIFPVGSDNPIRIDMFDDEIETMFFYDITSSKKIQSLKEFHLYPYNGVVINNTEFRSALEKLSAEHSDVHFLTKMYQKVQDFDKPAGYYWFLPHFYKGTTILSYFDSSIYSFDNLGNIIVMIDDITVDVENYYDVAKTIVETNNYPKFLLENFEEPSAVLEKLSDIKIFSRLGSNDGVSSNLSPVMEIFTYNKSNMVTALGEGFKVLLEYLRQNYTVVFASNIEKHVEAFIKYANEHQITTKEIHYLYEVEQNYINIYSGEVSYGFQDVHNKFLLCTGTDVVGFANKKSGVTGERKANKKRNVFKTSLADISLGDYVVHIDYGIGIFKGIVSKEIGGIIGDYIQIEYKEGNLLIIPIDKIGLIQKYVGSGGSATPRIDDINSSAWKKIKSSAKKRAKTIAIDLLKLYAERKSRQGFAFNDDGELLAKVESSFEYYETEDQLQAIQDIYNDMESDLPMERLLCGDVGYGKTEVAIRATTKAVASGKQVCIIAPTTVLVRQHFINLKKRFKDLPISVEFLSRFKTGDALRQTIRGIEEGSIDVIVGTHKLLSPNIVFKDLGLLIIDEEQRFGVQHKEVISSMRTNIDVLSMSATPIPRTMQLALSGIRQVSTIETPPPGRLPVRVNVTSSYDEVIEAIVFELSRQGRVYFLHNNLSDIDKVASDLKQALRYYGDVSVGIAHGQLNPKQLEDVLLNFYDGEIDILVCSTVVENGIDVSDANTIIIDDANNFGLSQLHQLKGRVGRGRKQAYCYLYVKEPHRVNEVSQKRLKIIQQLSSLGSGFKIAMHDLQLRGAGDLLGAEQSGFVVKVGYELFVQLIEDAVNELKGIQEKKNIAIFSNLPYYIPSEYISDVTERFEYYERFNLLTSKEEVEDLLKEVEDRYGALNQEIITLADTMLMQNYARRVGIVKLVITKRNVTAGFEDILFSVDDFIAFVMKSKIRVTFGTKENEIIIAHNEQLAVVNEYLDLMYKELLVAKQ